MYCLNFLLTIFISPSKVTLHQLKNEGFQSIKMLKLSNCHINSV